MVRCSPISAADFSTKTSAGCEKRILEWSRCAQMSAIPGQHSLQIPSEPYFPSVLFSAVLEVVRETSPSMSLTYSTQHSSPETSWRGYFLLRGFRSRGSFFGKLGRIQFVVTNVTDRYSAYSPFRRRLRERSIAFLPKFLIQSLHDFKSCELRTGFGAGLWWQTHQFLIKLSKLYQ